jgi:hypothetical protein
MNAMLRSALPTGGFQVPVTVRTLAACDARRLRERAVNWLALALLLAAWNVEARLDAGDVVRADDALSGDTPQTAGRPPGGFDWTQPRMTKWTSCAAHDSRRRGAEDR